MIGQPGCRNDCAISPWGMRSSFRWSRPWASGSAHWPRTSSAVDGRFSWVSKGVRVASGDLKMQRILKHLTEPTGERQHPFGTRLCLQSLVCYTLVPADAEKGLREVPASTCSVAEGCADGAERGDGALPFPRLRPRQAGGLNLRKRAAKMLIARRAFLSVNFHFTLLYFVPRPTPSGCKMPSLHIWCRI